MAYKEHKEHLLPLLPKQEKKVVAIINFLKELPQFINHPQEEIEELVRSTRLQLECYLDVQETQSDLFVIEQELIKLERKLGEWEPFKDEPTEEIYQWEPINEIAQQARKRICYLKKQEHEIMLLMAAYRTAIKNNDQTEIRSLKIAIKEMIKTAEQEVNLINV